MRGGSGFSEDLGSGDAEGTRRRRITESPTGTGCSLGSRDLWSSSGIGKGDVWVLSRFLEKRRGEYNFVVKGRKLHLSQDDKRVVAVVVLAFV